MVRAITEDLTHALDPAIFTRDRLGFTIRNNKELDPWQVKALRWSGKRLILNIHRQGGKSTIVAALALHRSLYRPDSLILLVSPSLRQSRELFIKVTELFSELDVTPKKLEDNKLSYTLENGSRVVSLPSKEATIRGFSGADLIVEDEAARVPDELYRAVRPMLAVSGGRLILMSTPFGKRGHFFEEWTEGQGWEKIEVKAPECSRITGEFLEEERASLGDWWVRQEYLCEFVEPVDSVFSHELVIEAMSEEVEPLFVGGGER